MRQPSVVGSLLVQSKTSCASILRVRDRRSYCNGYAEGISVVSGDGYVLSDGGYVLTGGGPDNSTLTVTMYLYNNGFKYFDFGYASALAYALALIVAVLGLLQVRLMGERK